MALQVAYFDAAQHKWKSRYIFYARDMSYLPVDPNSNQYAYNGYAHVT